MPDLSQIPFGPGVGIFTGQNKDLQYLFDPNGAVYKIDSSRDKWYVLFIRAKNDPGFDGDPPTTNGWEFTLESAPVEEVKKIYQVSTPESDIPRIVDNLGEVVSQNHLQGNPPNPGLQIQPEETEWKVGIGDPLVPKELIIKTKRHDRVYIYQEAGTYIMPIAYHIMTDSGLDIRQVARSDWSFWPVPRHSVWCMSNEIVSIELGGTTGTTPP